MAVYGKPTKQKDKLWDKHECVNPNDDNILDIAKDSFIFVCGEETFTKEEMGFIQSTISKAVSDILNKRHYTINVNVRVSKLSEKQAHERND